MTQSNSTSQHKTDWVKVGVLISLLIGAANIAVEVYKYSQERVPTIPRLVVSYVGDLILRQPSSLYTVAWMGEQFQIIVFVVSPHEFQLKVQSISFEISDEGKTHLIPQDIEETSVKIEDDFEVFGLASGSMNLLVPVDAKFWLRPESIVWEKYIEIGTLTFAITVTNLRTSETSSQTNETSVVWIKATE